MGLKLNFLEAEGRARAEGVLDGALPFAFEDLGDRWSVRIGEAGTAFVHEEPHPVEFGQVLAPRNIGELRSMIYHAVARYRSAMRGLLQAVPA